MARAFGRASYPPYRQLVWAAVLGASAWVGVLILSRTASMGMGATMGMKPAQFLGAWVLMMAAMMLPSAGPVAGLYVRAMGQHRRGRTALFLLGYLLVWTLIGVPAFLVALAIDSLAMVNPALIRWALVAVLVGLAAYQLTPLKRVCLAHCRSPLSQLLRYTSFSGSLRDLRVGGHHGLYCAGCCWPLMVLLVVAGVMNLIVMLALTLIIAAEKLLPRGQLVSRVIAGAALMAGCTVAVWPRLVEQAVRM